MATLFKETPGILERIQSNYQSTESALTTLEKMNLARECMEKVKNKPEYFEIEATLKELEKQYRYERAGVNLAPIVTPFSQEQAEKMAAVLNKETLEAEKKYKQLVQQAKEVTDLYLEKMSVIANEMDEIEKVKIATTRLWYMAPDISKMFKGVALADGRFMSLFRSYKRKLKERGF
jgi:hypothetical protein